MIAATKVSKEEVPSSGKTSQWGPSIFQYAKPSSVLKACLLRTYDKPKGHSGIEPADGSSSIKMWQAAIATSAAPVAWNRTRATRQSMIDHRRRRSSTGSSQQNLDQERNDRRRTSANGSATLHAADGGLVANNPVRHALQEAALLFPGRPLGLVLSFGLGRHKHEIGTPDGDCDDLANMIEEAGGKFVRLNPLINDDMKPTTTDSKILQQTEQDVIHYMKTSKEAQRAKRLLRAYLKDNPSIRGRYAKAIPSSSMDTHERQREHRHRMVTMPQQPLSPATRGSRSKSRIFRAKMMMVLKVHRGTRELLVDVMTSSATSSSSASSSSTNHNAIDLQYDVTKKQSPSLALSSEQLGVLCCLVATAAVVLCRRSSTR